jgi:hypothetical protein
MSSVCAVSGITSYLVQKLLLLRVTFRETDRVAFALSASALYCSRIAKTSPVS